MSHARAETETLEPNLTPLLDLVLQILMFFIATTSLSAEQVNADTMLPPAQFAKPIGNDEFLYLNINYNEQLGAHVLNILGRPELTTDKAPEDRLRVRVELERLYADLRRESRTGKVEVVVAIRGDRNATYAEIFQIVKLCQEVGFKTLSVRAFVDTSAG
jgi:biopolymer transport protein ExbD